MYFTFFSLLLLPEQDVEVAGALGAQRQQQGLHYGGSSGQTQQQRPHFIVTEHKVQAYHLQNTVDTSSACAQAEGRVQMSATHLTEEDADDDSQLV